MFKADYLGQLFPFYPYWLPLTTCMLSPLHLQVEHELQGCTLSPLSNLPKP